MSGVRIAVEGCGHGTLHAIYASVEQSCKVKGWPGVDLLIICGDFQAVRNAYDLNCVAMPAKYREMCDFHEYYSGARKAPYLTVFVGGNHEASNYLFELYYGGWVAENIYYMGAANVLQLGPLKIAGMSGIWKGYNYKKLHHERLPYNEDDIKSIYHVRELDTRKLLQLRGPVDIGISHDWPRGVEWKGDWKALFRRKEHLKPDADSGQLGNVAAKQVLDKLRPLWWFSGHLHCKYAAIVEHGQAQLESHKRDHSNGTITQAGTANGNGTELGTDEPVARVINAEEVDLDLDGDISVTKVVNDDEIDLDLDNVNDTPQVDTQPQGNGHSEAATLTTPDAIDLDLSDGDTSPKDEPNGVAVAEANASTQHMDDATAHTTTKATHFLALDKCLPGRDFLQLLEYPTDHNLDPLRPLKLAYDKEWLMITRAFAKSERLILGESKFNAPVASTDEAYAALIKEQQPFVDRLTSDQLVIPENFTLTAPVYDGGHIHDPRYGQTSGGLKEYSNPQTIAFCTLLDIPNPFDITEDERAERMERGPRPASDRSAFSHGRGRGRGGRGGNYNRGRGGARGHGRGRG